LKKLCNVDRNPVMENLSSSLAVEAARLLAAIIRNSRQKLKSRRWNSDDKVLALALLKCSPKSYSLQALFPLPCRRTLQSFLSAVRYKTYISADVFGTLAAENAC
jgi:hypothetical protein